MTSTNEVLNKELEELIRSRCGKVYSRRLGKDIADLLPEYSNYQLQFDYGLDVPVLIIEDNNDVFEITLHKHFPFKCPQKITINGAPYSSILICTNPYRKKCLKEMTGLDCLCCRSFICNNNWTIQTRLKNVVNEIKETIDINKRLDNYILNNPENDNNNNVINDDIKNLIANNPNKKRKIH
jgi:hypothetical protein